MQRVERLSTRDRNDIEYAKVNIRFFVVSKRNVSPILGEFTWMYHHTQKSVGLVDSTSSALSHNEISCFHKVLAIQWTSRINQEDVILAKLHSISDL